MKAEQYAALISSQLSGIFDEDCENCIDIEELQEGDNATEFIHALANMVPAMVYNKLSDEDLNMLQFNHLANQLIFQNKK